MENRNVLEKISTTKFNKEVEKEKIIMPPQGWYFIHGVKDWSEKKRIGILSPEISGSLQKDGYTKPLRPYGYILRLDKGAISKAFDCDVTSEYSDGYEKKLSEQGNAKKRKEYAEKELQELINNTCEKSHNELWIKGDKSEIIGAYIVDGSYPGVKSFLKICRREGLSIKFIEKITENN